MGSQSETFTSTSLPDAVKSLLESNNYAVQGPQHVRGSASLDMTATRVGDAFSPRLYIEVTVEHVNTEKFGKDLTKLAPCHESDPRGVCMIVSSAGFTEDVRGRKPNWLELLTYDELFSKFENFHPYISAVLEHGEIADHLAKLDSVYEPPLLDDGQGRTDALEWLGAWRDDPAARPWLFIVGEYGTGKTALTKILQLRWTRQYRENVKLSLPFRLELRDFSRQFDARGLLHHFLDVNNLRHLPVEFVTTLIHSGRILLLLDGYDEMAQYLNTRERRACLEALAELSQHGARGIITSRPNYFSEGEEFKVYEALYNSFKETRLLRLRQAREAADREKAIDELLTRHYLERCERTLKDLTSEQAEQLVARHLRNDPKGRDAVLDLLRRVSRSTVDGDAVSLSGKPVIVTYLLEVVEDVKNGVTASDGLPALAGEWDVYEYVVDRLMLRDYQRVPGGVTVSQRRQFLQRLALAVTRRDCPTMGEDDLRDLVREFFAVDLARLPRDERAQHAESLLEDVRSSSTLTRQLSGTATAWRFSHNSLREYLLCEHLLACLAHGALKDISVPVSDAMRTFVASRRGEAITRDMEHLQRAWPTPSRRGLGQLFCLLSDAMRRALSDQDNPAAAVLEHVCGKPAQLSDLELSNLQLSSVERPVCLSRATFASSDLRNVDLSGADCTSADFTGAILDSVRFVEANLRDAVFCSAVLIDVDVTEADVAGCDFRGADESSSVVFQRGPARIALQGPDAFGYLQHLGATTDDVPPLAVLCHRQAFAIVEKICTALNRNQRYHQRKGLEERGVCKKDPETARAFTKLLEQEGLIREKGGRPGMLEVTHSGMQAFSALLGEGELPHVAEEFLRSHD